MRISFDPAKRDATLRERDLDFLEAEFVLQGPNLRIADTRREYGEERTIVYGYLHGRMVVVVWTERADALHIISMRKANEKEQRRIAPLLR